MIVCLYVTVYVCLYLHVHLFVCMYVNQCMYMCMSVFFHACSSKCAIAHVCRNTDLYVCHQVGLCSLCVSIYVYVMNDPACCSLPYMHTCIHTYLLALEIHACIHKTMHACVHACIQIVQSFIHVNGEKRPLESALYIQWGNFREKCRGGIPGENVQRQMFGCPLPSSKQGTSVDKLYIVITINTRYL